MQEPEAVTLTTAAYRDEQKQSVARFLDERCERTKDLDDKAFRCSASVLSAEAFVKLAMIHLMLNRLEPKETDAEFRYREVA